MRGLAIALLVLASPILFVTFATLALVVRDSGLRTTPMQIAIVMLGPGLLFPPAAAAAVFALIAIPRVSVARCRGCRARAT